MPVSELEVNTHDTQSGHTEGKWLLSRPCQQVPPRNRVIISELLSNLCSQEKQNFSPDAMAFTGAHVDRESYPSRKP